MMFFYFLKFIFLDQYIKTIYKYKKIIFNNFFLIFKKHNFNRVPNTLLIYSAWDNTVFTDKYFTRVKMKQWRIISIHPKSLPTSF